jgi:DNA-binding IclR family transcriptional regulator
MTKREQIEAMLASGPMTGAQIRARIGGTATNVHRYLNALRHRGVLAARDNGGVLLYGLPGSMQRRAPVSAWDWRAAA